MTVFELHCVEPWFTFIQRGLKPVEGRKNSPKYNQIKTNDYIKFFCGSANFLTEVRQVRHFTTLEEYLKSVTIQKALPGIATLEEAIHIYLQWNSREEIEKHGFLGIFIQLI